LAAAKDIKEVQSGLKKTHKEFAKLDGKAKEKLLPANPKGG
jgi:hypothetical protein